MTGLVSRLTRQISFIGESLSLLICLTLEEAENILYFKELCKRYVDSVDEAEESSPLPQNFASLSVSHQDSLVCQFEKLQTSVPANDYKGTIFGHIFLFCTSALCLEQFQNSEAESVPCVMFQNASLMDSLSFG
jgi:hypothetical protein